MAEIFGERAFYVVLLGLSLVPLVIKKELKELKIASILLFLGVTAFLLILTFQLIFEGNFDNPDKNYKSYFELDRDLNFVKGLSMILVAFSF